MGRGDGVHVGQEIIISPKVIRCGCGRFMNGDDKKINFQNMSKHRYFFVFVRIVWVSIFAGYTFFLMQNGAIFRGCYFGLSPGLLFFCNFFSVQRQVREETSLFLSEPSFGIWDVPCLHSSILCRGRKHVQVPVLLCFLGLLQRM